MTDQCKPVLFEQPFYFLRHGETRMNADRRIAGSVDTELTELGIDQARQAARALADQPITAIYASPLQRARDTALIVAERLRLPIVSIAEIAERNWGVLEGQPRASRVPGITPQGAETFEAFADRVLAGLAKIDAAVPLVVAHSGVFRVLCRSLAIVETQAPVANALPLRFEPHPQGWQLVGI